MTETTARGPRVYMVDDDAGVRRALERLLTAAGFDVATFSHAQEFLERSDPPGPACLILDQRMPGTTGLELQKKIAASDSLLSIVFLTGHGDVRMSVAAMKAGAVDFLVKPIEAGQLIDAVTRALAFSTQAWQTRAERDDFLRRVGLLSVRERQVGVGVIRGLLNKQIAWELGIAERTVKVHRARLMRKLQVTSVAELVRTIERLDASLDAAPELEEAIAARSRTTGQRPTPEP